MALPKMSIFPGIAEALGTAPAVIEAGAPFRKTDKERLAELERRAAMGTLGFTPAQEDVYRRELLAPAQALAAQQMIDQRALQAATGGATGGAAFASQMAAQEAEQRRIAEAQAELTKADMEVTLRQQDEIIALGRAEDKAKADRRAALLGGAVDVGSTLFGLGLETRRLKETTGATRGRGSAEDDYTDDYLGD